MSRKKFQQPDNTIGARLRWVREHLGKGTVDFAESTGCSQGSLSAYENNLSSPKSEFFLNLYQKHEINIHWLLTGEGEAFSKQADDSGLFLEMDLDEPAGEKAELLRMASEVLDSKESYSASLAANIRSFHEAISTTKRLNVVESEVAEIKKAIKITAGKTRDGDPPEKKEELLQKRVISSG